MFTNPYFGKSTGRNTLKICNLKIFGGVLGRLYAISYRLNNLAITDLNRLSVFKHRNMFEHVNERAEGRVVCNVTYCKASSD